MKIRILSASCPDYNPDLSRDGGSYFKPKGSVLVSDGDRTYLVCIDDDSCGDFGIRRDVVIRTTGNVTFHWHLNTVNENDDGSDKMWDDAQRWYDLTGEALVWIYSEAFGALCKELRK